MINTKRIREIDLLRGFAAICMVLGHSFIKYPVNISAVPWCSSLQYFIYNFHMELFFVLAGIVYFCSDYGSFISKKVKRMMIPYAFFGVVNAVFHAFGGTLVSNSVSIKDGLIKIVCQGGGYWFLYSLFTVFLIYPFVEKIFNKPWKEAVLAFVIAFVQQLVELPAQFMIDTTVYYIPYFILGHAVSGGLKNGKIWSCPQANVVIFIVCVIGYIVLDGYGKNHDINHKLPDYLRAICVIVALATLAHWFVLVCNQVRIFGYIERFFGICSRYAMQIYLFNAYLMGGIRMIVCSLMNIESPLAIVLCLLSGNLVITLVSCKWIIPRVPIVRTLCGLNSKETVK